MEAKDNDGSAAIDERPGSEPYMVDEQIGFLLRVAFQFHTSIFTSRMVSNLTQTQFATLSKIHQSRECSQSDLVQILELDSATINGVASRMKARGFLAISADPSDRRRQFLSLTPKGEKVMAEAEEIGREVTDQTIALLTPTEQARLVQLLHKMMGRPMPDVQSAVRPADRRIRLRPVRRR